MADVDVKKLKRLPLFKSVGGMHEKLKTCTDQSECFETAMA